MFHTVRQALIDTVRYFEITRLKKILDWMFEFLDKFSALTSTEFHWVIWVTRNKCSYMWFGEEINRNMSSHSYWLTHVTIFLLMCGLLQIIVYNCNNSIQSNRNVQYWCLSVRCGNEVNLQFILLLPYVQMRWRVMCLSFITLLYVII